MYYTHLPGVGVVSSDFVRLEATLCGTILPGPPPGLRDSGLPCLGLGCWEEPCPGVWSPEPVMRCCGVPGFPGVVPTPAPPPVLLVFEPIL